MKWSRRIQTRAVALAMAGLLGTFMLAFLALAGYLALQQVVQPVLAALIIAAVLLLVALLVWLVTHLITRRRSYKRRRHIGEADLNPFDGLEETLERCADPVLRDWVRRHPDRAAAMTVLLGIAAGYSGSVRRVLQDLYNHYAEAEGRRRSGD